MLKLFKKQRFCSQHVFFPPSNYHYSKRGFAVFRPALMVLACQLQNCLSGPASVSSLGVLSESWRPLPLGGTLNPSVSSRLQLGFKGVKAEDNKLRLKTPQWEQIGSEWNKISPGCCCGEAVLKLFLKKKICMNQTKAILHRVKGWNCLIWDEAEQNMQNA